MSASSVFILLSQSVQFCTGFQSGLVKLDECVDTDGKYLLVEFGWKPAFSDAAAGAATKMAQGAAASQGQQGAASKSNKSAVKPAKGYRKKSSLKDDF